MSRDQKSSEKDEMKRILQYNGRISQYFDEESRSFIGHKRIWLKNSDIPDLAITRIFGDLIVHSVGVIVEPEIGIYYFGGCETFIIVASDGVWDLNDSEESVHYVKKFYENGLDACGVVNVLVKEAYRRWRRDNEKKEYEKFEEYLIKQNNKNEFEENEKHNFEFNEEDEEKESEVKVKLII